MHSSMDTKYITDTWQVLYVLKESGFVMASMSIVLSGHEQAAGIAQVLHFSA